MDYSTVGATLQVSTKNSITSPFRSLQITERGDILYNITKKQLERHPRFNYKEELPYEDYYSSYRNPSPPFQMGAYRGRYSPWEWAYFPSRLSVSAILNSTVLNNKGEELGDIDDLMIDREGRIEEVILAVGGFKFMEMGEKLVVLPFKPLKITDLGILYNITVQQLKNLPEFSYERRRP